jgi:hypothetical protein
MLRTLDEENTEICERGGKDQTAAIKSITGMLKAVKAGWVYCTSAGIV